MKIEEAVRKLTGAAADRLGIGSERGYIKEGLAADITLFDLDKLQVDVEGGRNHGIEYVLVGGEPALIKGALTFSRKGRMIGA